MALQTLTQVTGTERQRLERRVAPPLAQRGNPIRAGSVPERDRMQIEQLGTTSIAVTITATSTPTLEQGQDRQYRGSSGQ